MILILSRFLNYYSDICRIFVISKNPIVFFAIIKMLSRLLDIWQLVKSYVACLHLICVEFYYPRSKNSRKIFWNNTHLRIVKGSGTYVNSAVKDVEDQNLRYRPQAGFIITRRGGSGQVSAALRRPFTPLNLITGTSVSRTLLGFTSLYTVPRYYGSFVSRNVSSARY